MCQINRMELNSHSGNDLHKIVDSRRDLLERSPGSVVKIILRECKLGLYQQVESRPASSVNYKNREKGKK